MDPLLILEKASSGSSSPMGILNTWMMSLWSCQYLMMLGMSVSERRSRYKRFDVFALDVNEVYLRFVIHPVPTMGTKSRHSILSVVLRVNWKVIEKSLYPNVYMVFLLVPIFCWLSSLKIWCALRISVCCQ